MARGVCCRPTSCARSEAGEAPALGPEAGSLLGQRPEGGRVLTSEGAKGRGAAAAAEPGPGRNRQLAPAAEPQAASWSQAARHTNRGRVLGLHQQPEPRATTSALGNSDSPRDAIRLVQVARASVWTLRGTGNGAVLHFLLFLSSVMLQFYSTISAFLIYRHPPALYLPPPWTLTLTLSTSHAEVRCHLHARAAWPCPRSPLPPRRGPLSNRSGGSSDVCGPETRARTKGTAMAPRGVTLETSSRPPSALLHTVARPELVGSLGPLPGRLPESSCAGSRSTLSEHFASRRAQRACKGWG